MSIGLASRLPRSTAPRSPATGQPDLLPTGYASYFRTSGS
jgi:hypothetical protein